MSRPRPKHSADDTEKETSLLGAVALVSPSAVTDVGVTLITPGADLSPTATTSPNVTRRRHKVATSCNRCRQNKRKCNGSLPCANCNRANVDCRYTDAQQSRTLWGDTPLSPEKVLGHRRATQGNTAFSSTALLSLQDQQAPTAGLSVITASSPCESSPTLSSRASSPSSSPTISRGGSGVFDSMSALPFMTPSSTPGPSRRSKRQSVRAGSVPSQQQEQQQQQQYQTHSMLCGHTKPEQYQHSHEPMSLQKPFLDIQQSHCENCAAKHSQGQSSASHGSMTMYRPLPSFVVGDEYTSTRWDTQQPLFEDGTSGGDGDPMQTLTLSTPLTMSYPTQWWPPSTSLFNMSSMISSDQSQHDNEHEHHSIASTLSTIHPLVMYDCDSASQSSIIDHQHSPWNGSNYLSPTMTSSATFQDTPSPSSASGLMFLSSPPSPSPITSLMSPDPPSFTLPSLQPAHPFGAMDLKDNVSLSSLLAHAFGPGATLSGSNDGGSSIIETAAGGSTGEKMDKSRSAADMTVSPTTTTSTHPNENIALASASALGSMLWTEDTEMSSLFDWPTGSISLEFMTDSSLPASQLSHSPIHPQQMQQEEEKAQCQQHDHLPKAMIEELANVSLPHPPSSSSPSSTVFTSRSQEQQKQPINDS